VGTTASEFEVMGQAADDDVNAEHASDRRMVDRRVSRLAQYLLTAEDSDEITGDMVGSLLRIEVAPRTGRRLLGQARALIDQVDRVDLDFLNDPEPSISHWQ
jgi:hypothetical protein